MHIRFWLDFVRGKARARIGNGHQYTPPQTRADMAAVRTAYREAGGKKAPKGVPVSLSVTSHRHLPKSVKSELADTHKPDLDNVVKLVMDGLNKVAWEDDSQVTRIHASKTPRDAITDDWMHVTVSWEDE